MKFAKKMSLVLILATAAFTAHAVDAQAKFKLTHAAHIGTGILPAGEYLVTMYAEGATKAFITPADHSGAAIIALPVGTDGYTGCEKSSLIMQVTGSVWNVRSVCFAGSHTTLYFPVPVEKATATASRSETTVIASAN